MSELESLSDEVADAIDRVRVPSYVIDRHGIIRWVNPASQARWGRSRPPADLCRRTRGIAAGTGDLYAEPSRTVSRLG
jgi:hypothetical protein